MFVIYDPSYGQPQHSENCKYDRNRSFIILATVITIINYDHRSFMVQATDIWTTLNLLKIETA